MEQEQTLGCNPPRPSPRGTVVAFPELSVTEFDDEAPSASFVDFIALPLEVVLSVPSVSCTIKSY